MTTQGDPMSLPSVMEAVHALLANWGWRCPGGERHLGACQRLRDFVATEREAVRQACAEAVAGAIIGREPCSTVCDHGYCDHARAARARILALDLTGTSPRKETT